MGAPAFRARALAACAVRLAPAWDEEQKRAKSGGRVSNPRPRAWEARALPAELPPHAYSIGVRLLRRGARLGKQPIRGRFPLFRSDFVRLAASDRGQKCRVGDMVGDTLSERGQRRSGRLSAGPRTAGPRPCTCAQRCEAEFAGTPENSRLDISTKPGFPSLWSRYGRAPGHDERYPRYPHSPPGPARRSGPRRS